MKKNKIINFVKLLEIAILAFISLICITIFLISDSNSIKFIVLGAGIGAIIGGIIDIKIIIPRNYKDKDERSIIILLLSQISSYLIGFILLFITFTFTVVNVIDIMNICNFIIFTLILATLIIVIEKVTYNIIEKRM